MPGSGEMDLRVAYRPAQGWVVVMPCPEPPGVCSCSGEDVYGPFPGRKAAQQWRDKRVAGWPSSPQAQMLRELEDGAP
jgi:hypothetical protein